MSDLRSPLRLLCAAVALVLATGPAIAEERTLTGTVTYRERIALPPEARVEVELLDVSRADAPSVTIAETAFVPETQVPLAFALDYDGSVIDARHSYALRARILQGDEVLFRTVQHFGVLTRGQASTELVLERAAVPAETPVGRWLAEDIGGGGVVDRVRTVLELGPDGRVSGSGGCNAISGQAELSGAALSFGPLATTRKLCPPAVMDQEAKFLAALGGTRSWKIDPDRRKLILLDATGRTVAAFARD
ncbi:YbaY family lipoprotein [Mangrovicoccus sp. HB161399]|uniref:YbaY family lipoprotein n=1 Tax=Mangrovicoccus sp. HB161399 TaxID=2720392 RepID=UPI001555E866|nr:YbaY family lipoprotein [Mangrovicoccus sp. HB161399]